MQVNVYFQNPLTKPGMMTVTFTRQLFCLQDKEVHMIALHHYVSNQNIFLLSSGLNGFRTADS